MVDFKPLPVRYRQSSEAIVSFSFTDFADGTGIQTFYAKVDLTSAENSDAQDKGYTLDQSIVFSTDIVSTITTQDYVGLETDYVKSDNVLTFDLTSFNTTRRIKGTALIQNTWGQLRANDTIRVKIKYILQKWDGSTATEIGSAFTSYFADTVFVPHLAVVPISIAGTSFKPGDVLRLVVEPWGKMQAGAGTGTTTITFGTDPLNRDDPGAKITPASEDEETTQLVVNVPFEIKDL